MPLSDSSLAAVLVRVPKHVARNRITYGAAAGVVALVVSVSNAWLGGNTPGRGVADRANTLLEHEYESDKFQPLTYVTTDGSIVNESGATIMGSPDNPMCVLTETGAIWFCQYEGQTIEARYLDPDLLLSGDNVSELTNDAGYLTGIAWGQITGTLSSQTDLQSALDAKYDDSNPDGFVSDLMSFDTGDLAEGSNLYFTDQRAVDALTGSAISMFVNDAAYLTSEADPFFSAFAGSGITASDITNWDTAFGWGNHALAGYLTSFTETDPIFDDFAGSGITLSDIGNWNTAFGWGDHASEGYLTSFTETDPFFQAFQGSGITTSDITNWDTAFSWGDHSAVGYITNLSGFDTDDLSEGSNLYFTEGRARSAISSTGAILFTGGVVSLDYNFNFTGVNAWSGSHVFLRSPTAPGAGTNSLRYGLSASAAGQHATALGISSSAGQIGTLALGASANASSSLSTAIGGFSTASQTLSTAIGYFSQATGVNAFALGGLTTAAGQNSLALGTSVNVGADNSVAIGWSAAIPNSSHTQSLAIGPSGTVTGPNQAVFGSNTAAYNAFFFGKGVTNAAPNATVAFNATGGAGTNIAGSALVLNGGRATGNATSGYVSLQTAPPGTSGTAAQTLIERVRFKNATEVVFNDSGADYDFRVEGDTDPYLLYLNAGSGSVNIGTGTGSSKLNVNGNIESMSGGIVLRSPDSSRWLLQVTNTGALTVTGL